MVDHIDRNGLNNTKANLRLATDQESTRNRGAHIRRKNLTCEYKGVSKQHQKWIARIKVDGRDTYLGSFSDPIEAARAYDNAALELFGVFAYLNFPKGAAK